MWDEELDVVWDAEVDVAVIGAGIGGLSVAIATHDAGGDVLVVDVLAPAHHADAAPGAVRERVGTRQRQLLPDTLDAETIEYFAAVTEGLSMDGLRDGAVPRRNARNLTQEEVDRRVVEPFFGSRLHGWAEKCASSPYGLMHTSMRDWRTTKMRSADGQSIEVTAVGTVDLAGESSEGALQDWASEEARQRDIDVQTVAALQRIVFDDGVIVGIVLDTADGPFAVRTRVGVTLSPSDQDSVPYVPSGTAAGDRLQVCLVSRVASRFGRVELLSTEPAAARPTCTGSRHQIREGMHDARQPALEGWRCGKVHGYPAFG